MTTTNEASFTSWRKAWLNGRVEPDLYTFVTHVLASAAGSSTLPETLSPTGSWDADSRQEVVQGFWERKLLRGTLARAFDRTRNAPTFSRYLERSLRNWLIDEARAKGAPRIPARIQTLLNDSDAFARYGEAPQPVDEHWGLDQDGWAQLAPFVGESPALLAELYAVGEIALLPPSRGERADAVVSTEELERVLVALFGRIRAWLTPGELTQALRGRLPAYFPRGEVSDERAAIEVPDTEPSIPDLLDAEAAARQAIAAMSDRQLAILRGRLLDRLTLEELAAEYGCSRGTADNEFKRAAAAVRDVATPEDITAVWKKIIELSS
jgi:RNA polymerase sigma factor (sigma-70 family)